MSASVAPTRSDAAAGASRPVRVLLVGPSLRFLGGQAVQMQRLHAYLGALDGLAVDTLVVDPVLPKPLDALQRIKYVRTIVTSVAYVLSLVWRVPRYDVIHAFSASYWSFLLAPVPALLVGRLFGKRVLINYRSGEAPDHLARWGWHAIPLLRMASLVVTPSGYLVDVFARFGITARSVVNFLDIAALPYRRRTTLAPRFLSNRNFEVHYDVATVLRAFARIQAEVPDATLDVVGDGPLRETLLALATELGVRNVTFVGAIPPTTMREHYDAADIYLNAPTIDNMPNSVIEAFGCGLPVVSSNAGGIPYIVTHDVTGLLVAPGDPSALADAALALLRDPVRAVRLADAARAEATSRYTWDAVRHEWLAAYGAPRVTAA
jgi:L-malate glycosyltransferase